MSMLGRFLFGKKQRKDLYEAGEETQIAVPGTRFVIPMCWCPTGYFMMGRPKYEDPGPVPQELLGIDQPQHKVSITGFWIGKYAVTMELFISLMGDEARSGLRDYYGVDTRPARGVTWFDCKKFINTLNSTVTNGGFRLPSEAEWEYAARAGTTTRSWVTDDMYSNDVATHEVVGTEVEPVGSRRPNPWGLYDVLGNVKEWCEDHFHENYKGAPNDGSAWTETGDPEACVARGTTGFGAYHYRSAVRSMYDPNHHTGYIGFRLARSEIMEDT